MNDSFVLIGCNIKNLRLQNKLTQKELADKVGVSHEWICKIERGKAKNITLSLLNSIADNLHVEFKDLNKI
jgi:transcriptional regulator with XRE-family HTH domain